MEAGKPHLQKTGERFKSPLVFIKAWKGTWEKKGTVSEHVLTTTKLPKVCAHLGRCNVVKVKSTHERNTFRECSGIPTREKMLLTICATALLTAAADQLQSRHRVRTYITNKTWQYAFWYHIPYNITMTASVRLVDGYVLWDKRLRKRKPFHSLGYLH